MNLLVRLPWIGGKRSLCASTALLGSTQASTHSLFVQNLELVKAVESLAAAKGCTTSQLALAWVHAQGEDVFPIPGTRRTK
jgi:aryl-alcohol dehydrogenase-like predicted oxidoreductase